MSAYELLRQKKPKMNENEELADIVCKAEEEFQATFFNTNCSYSHCDTAIKSFFKPLVEALIEVDPTSELIIPIQLLMLGGDDLWLATTSELGFLFAAAYHWYYHHPVRRSKLPKHFPQDLSFAAGILVHPAKFPFATAYAMTEDLCASAKSKCRQYGSTVSTIDWHILKNNSVHENLADYRRREYLVEGQYNGKEGLTNQTLYLTGRPYLFDTSYPVNLNEENVAKMKKECCAFKQQLGVATKLLSGLENKDDDSYARNKLKGLRVMLRKGKKASDLQAETLNLFHRYDAQSRLKLPKDSLWHEIDSSTFLTPWLDLNELLDFCPRSYAIPPEIEPSIQTQTTSTGRTT